MERDKFFIQTEGCLSRGQAEDEVVFSFPSSEDNVGSFLTNRRIVGLNDDFHWPFLSIEKSSGFLDYIKNCLRHKGLLSFSRLQRESSDGSCRGSPPAPSRGLSCLSSSTKKNGVKRSGRVNIPRCFLTSVFRYLPRHPSWVVPITAISGDRGLKVDFARPFLYKQIIGFLSRPRFGHSAV